jgi:Tol biopolymer transport system component
MNTITHQQARDLIDRRLDERLKANQQTLLDEHLRSCDTCRLYASKMDLIPARLTHEFQARWDDDPGPSVHLMEHVTSRAKRIPAANRFSSNLRFLSGAAALLLLALVVNFVVSKLQSTSASTNGTATLSAPVNLTIDPQSCKPSAQSSAPNELYGYDVIQNASLVEGDFTFDFWLYCDPSLNGNDQEHFSAISGLGIYSLWRYNGQPVDGPVEYYYGFEENEVIGKSGSDGPLYKASAEGKSGINISEATILEYIEQGNPVQYRVTVNSSLGQNSAILSFHLEPTQSGLKVVGVEAHGPENFDSGLIAFTAASKEGGDLDIYTVYPDGSGLKNLTNNPEADTTPVWSPDGKRIAFVSARDGNENIYVMNADGSNVTRLTDDPAMDTMPLWSPDGTKIAYTSGNLYLNDTNIYVVNVDGQNSHRVTNYAPKTIVFSQAWSPDGLYIYFLSNGQISKVNVQSKEVVPVTSEKDPPGPFALSKDGSKLFYLTECDQNSLDFCNRAKIVDLNSMEEQVSVTMKVKEICPADSASSGKIISHYYIMRWSPDRSKILFGFYCEENNHNGGWLYVANADGLAFQSLTLDPILYAELPAVEWSADSQSVVFASRLDDQKHEQLYTLNVQDALQNPKIRPAALNISVSQIFELAWQPTSQSETVKQKPTPKPEQTLSASGLLAFVSDQSGNADIYTMLADGSELNNLTNSPAQDSNPIWSRDGRYIAFESRSNGFTQIYRMDADGSNLIQLTNDNADHSLSLNLNGNSNPWSPNDSKLLVLQSASGGDIWDLYVMGSDGENKILLASGRFSLNSISWSPDGKHIAYVLNEASNPNEAFVTGMYIMDSNGSNSRELKNYIPQGQNLDAPYYWSADGQSIVFIASSEHAKQETIYEFNLNSDSVLEKNSLPGVVDWQNDVALTWEKDLVWRRSDGSTNTLAWDDSSCLADITRSSHNNFAIDAYCSDSHKFKLYVANADGSVIKQLLDSSNIIGEIGELVWSLDDRYITFPITTGKETSLYILNVEAALGNPFLEPAKIVIGSHDLLHDIPSWQPVQTTDAVAQEPQPTPVVPSQKLPNIGTGKSNGEWIAFLAGKTISSINLPNLYLVHPDGTGLVNLTGSPEYYFWPQWSPNGKHLLFARGNHTFEILRVTDMNSFEVLLTTDIPLDKPFEYQYSWSPNSEQIAFLDSRDGNIDIYTAYADGRNDLGYTRLTTDPAQDYGFVWSPDGSEIAFQRLDGKQFSIMIMNADGSNQHEVARGSDEVIPFRSSNVRLRWSFDGASLYASSVGNSWLDCSGCVQKPAIYRIDLEVPSVQQIYYEPDASKVAGWYLYDTPQNTLYFMRIEPANFLEFWGSWFRADGNTVSELGELDPQQACQTTTSRVLNESISPNERFSVISVFCAGGFDLYLADREAAEANQRILHLLRLPLDTVGQGGDFATLPIGWSPDGRWLIYDNGNGSLYLLDIEKALRDPHTAPVPLLHPESVTGADSLSVLGLTWQSAP